MGSFFRNSEERNGRTAAFDEDRIGKGNKSNIRKIVL